MKFLSKVFAICLPFLGQSKERSRLDMIQEMLPKLAAIESSGNPYAMGDGGKSIGMYQISKNAWKDACDWQRLKDNDLTEFLSWVEIGKDWKKECFDEEKSRLIAMCYLLMLAEKISAYGHKVDERKLYMAYNMGFSQAKKFNFNMNNVLLSDKKKAIFYRASVILDSHLTFPPRRR